mgnify:CR=1 FL=1
MDKILFIIDTLQTGGAEKSLLEITSRFKKYKPVFIQLYNGSELKPLFEENGIEVIQLNLKPSYNFRSVAKLLIPIVKKIAPLIIHTTLFRSDLVGRALKRYIDVPLINSLVNNSYSRHRYKSLGLVDKMKLFAIQQWDRMTVKNVNLFVSNSESIKITNGAALGIPLDKIKVIYRGRDRNKYQMTDEIRKQIRESLGLVNEKIFLNVSRLLDRKGQIDLIRAFAKFVPHCSNARLWIAGEGQLRIRLENEIRENRLEGKVILLGNRKDVPNLLASADYFVFPSHYEGLPGALVEAMMARIPIIASAIPENLECIDASMALLYPRGEVEALASCLHEAVTANWTEKKELAYQKAVNVFDINMVAMRYEEAYGGLLDS